MSVVFPVPLWMFWARWCFFPVFKIFFLTDEVKCEGFGSEALENDEPHVSMLIFFYSFSQEEIGLIPLQRAGLLTAIGGTLAPLHLSPAISATISPDPHYQCSPPFLLDFPHSVFKYWGRERAFGIE